VLLLLPLQMIARRLSRSHLLSPAAADGSTASDNENESAGEASAEPPAVLPGRRLPSVVAAAVRLLGASPAQLKAWGSLQEVLQEDELDQQQQQQQQQKGNKKAAHQDNTQQEGSADGAEGKAAEQAGDAEKALAEHFDDVQIAGRSVQWWGRAGLELLRAAVQQRLLRYPGKGLSIAADEQALQELRSKQQQQEKGSKQPAQKQKQQGGGSDEEHAAAVAAALQLRICEQRILKQTLDAIEQVLG
jgi:hypothetical protein